MPYDGEVRSFHEKEARIRMLKVSFWYYLLNLVREPLIYLGTRARNLRRTCRLSFSASIRNTVKGE